MDSDDKKVSQLTRVTSLSDSDLFVVVTDMGTTPTTKAIEKSNVFNVSTGRWTPTLTNTTNIGTSLAYESHYMRINDQVLVSGLVAIDATATGSVVMKMSLPVSSNFTSTEDASGSISSPNGVVGSIIPDSAEDALDFRFSAAVTTNVFYRFMAVYRIK